MRDAFFKSLKSQDGRSGSAAISKKPYVFHNQMSFLIPTLLSRRTSGIPCEIESSSSELQDEEHSQPSGSGTMATSSQGAPLKKKKKKSENKFETQLLNILNKNLSNSADDQNPDRLFLLSLLPKMSHIPESNKLEFKIQVMQLLQKFTSAAE